MGAFVAGNALSALAPSYAVLMAGRVVSALAFGTFFGVANVVAVRLVDEGSLGKALGLLASGLTVSTVVGVPFGTFVGQQLGWRWAFWLVAALGVLALLGIAALVPKERDGEPPELRAEVGALARPQVLLSLGMTALGFGGVFTSFTYIAPQLREISGFSQGGVAALLVLFGAGSVVGTTAGGRLADYRRLDPILLGSFAALSAALAAFTLTIHSQLAAAVTVFVLGVVGYVAVPGLASRIVREAGDAPTLSSTANISAFSAANAGGAFLGGTIIGGGFGLVAVNWAGALVALSGVIVAALAMLLALRARRSAAPDRIGGEDRPPGRGDRRGAPRRSDHAQPAQQTHGVELAPVLDYLAVGGAHDVHPHRLDPFAGRGHAQELALVGAAHQPAHGDLVPFPYHVRFGYAHVGEGLAHRGEPAPRPIGIGRRPRERVVADPGLPDPAPHDVVELDARHRDPLAGGGDPQKLAPMGPSCRPSADDLVPLGYLVFHHEAGVGEGRAVRRRVPFRALRAVHVSRKARVVEDVVEGEEVLHEFEVSSGQHLLEPPTDQGLVRLGHGAPPLRSRAPPDLRRVATDSSVSTPGQLGAAAQDRGARKLPRHPRVPNPREAHRPESVSNTKYRDFANGTGFRDG